MVSRLERYSMDSARWGVQKFCSVEKFKFTSVKLHVSLNNLKSFEDIAIIRVLNMLEQITGQKPSIKNYESKYVGSTRKFYITCEVTLRRNRMLNFLDYLVTVVFPQEVRRYGKYNLTTSKNSLVVGLKDWGILYGYRGESFDGVLNIELKGKSQERFVDFLNLFKVPVNQIRK